MAKDKNHVSVWFWMFALFIMAIPCIGLVMVVVWAFWGDNESRKNYFRALILWGLIFAALWTTLILLGVWPELWVHIQKEIQEVRYWMHWPKQ